MLRKYLLLFIFIWASVNKTDAQIPLQYPLSNSDKILDYTQQNPRLVDLGYTPKMYNIGAISCTKQGKIKYFEANSTIYSDKGKRLYSNDPINIIGDCWILEDLEDTSIVSTISVGGVTDSVGVFYTRMKRVKDTLKLLSGSRQIIKLPKKRVSGITICPSDSLNKYYILCRRNYNSTTVFSFSPNRGVYDSHIYYGDIKNVVTDTVVTNPNDVKQIPYFCSYIYMNNNNDKVLSISGILKSNNDNYIQSTTEVFIVVNNFDKQTGRLSKGKLIAHVYIKKLENNYFWPLNLSAAFSQSGRYIYFYFDGFLQQYDLQTDELTRLSVIEEYLIEAKTLMLGPDNRIYILHAGINKNGIRESNKIQYIPYPDKKAPACGVKETNLKVWSTAFPNFINNTKKAGFTFQQECNQLKLTAECDESFYTSYKWYCGKDSAEGKVAYLPLPKNGRYAVSMRASSKEGYVVWITDTVSVAVLNAQFTTESKEGCQWIGFKFINQTDTTGMHNIQWRWDFGDSTADTAMNPMHIYRQAGSYTIRLIAINGMCNDTFIQTEKIIIRPAPKPGFSVTPKEGCAPLNVSVVSLTQDKGLKYRFDFGDGTTDSTSTVNHLFASPGSYFIKQYLYSPAGCVTSDSFLVHVFSKIGKVKSDIICVSNDTLNSKPGLEINWQNFPQAAFYRLKRQQENSTQQIEIILKNHHYTDNTVSPEKFVYSYEVEAIDSCGNITSVGFKGKNILLQGHNQMNEVAHLKWSPYNQWPQGVNYYVVQKKQGDVFKEIVQVPSTTTEYTDVNYYNNLASEAVYRITAVAFADSLKSISNELRLPYHFILGIPNAFSPNGDGINDTFKIAATFNTNLELFIYNRWGELIYSCKNFNNHPVNENIGWDGRINGKLAPEGIYMFRISARDSQGNPYEKKGTIMLLK